MDRTATKPLAALALAAFGIGTTEFVIMGLLPDVARDLGVGIPAAGLLVSGYALGVAFGGPLLARLTARLPSRRALFLLLGLFIMGNAACALAPGYGWLMAARIVTAFCHAAFLGVGSVIAAGLVPPEKRAQAIALMIGGLTLATVLGVPFGTLLGQAAGWRTTFWAVTVAGLVAFAGLMFWLPKGNEQRRNLRAELRALRALPVWLTLGISVVASTSMFTFFTYITPILTDVSGVEPSYVSGVLLVCGIGLTLGNFIGARLADWRALPSLAGILAAVALVLIGFGFIGAVPLLATTAVVVWGIVAFAVCAILQAEAVARAEAAPNLAATLNIAAFNLGNAMGAGLGAFALTRGLPMAGVPALAGGVAFLALLLTTATIIVTRKRADLGQCCPMTS
ncbi:MFS transporter [Aureimonas populi]|uniref:MFS transporter n=1 Tax=Aureimonas populi TaxID=1701758 RepID=A0ABW5CN54_9HYPH|nr:MFS transporter [Aureimonas populi]